MNLLAESRPEDTEVKSEAAFQRLITSCSELPTQPRTPRALTDRGRYPEEAGLEESQREDTPSDDEDHFDEEPFAFQLPGGREPIPIRKPGSSAGNGNNDDLNMSTSETSSIGALSMDVDMVASSCFIHQTVANILQPSCSSLLSMTSTPTNGWRYTPPSTTSAIRSNKRKRECSNLTLLENTQKLWEQLMTDLILIPLRRSGAPFPHRCLICETLIQLSDPP